MRGRVAGGRGGAAAQAAYNHDLTVEVTSGQGTRGAHLKHIQHTCDARRVEAQRLVECRALPSAKGSIGRGATCRPGGGRAWGGGGARSAQGGPKCGGHW